MAVELTLVLRFEEPSSIPSREEVEDDLDCIEIERDEQEV